MQVKRIDKWLNGSELSDHLTKKNILDWLEEEGSITARISSHAEFKLEILNDDIGVAEDEEYIALEMPPEEVRIREVVLYGDLVPSCLCKKHYPRTNSIKRLSWIGDYWV